MPNHQQVVVNPSKQLRDKYDRVVEIVTANPGISAARIAKQYYGDSLTSQQRNLIVSVLTQLCVSKRIQYQSIDSYMAVD